MNLRTMLITPQSPLELWDRLEAFGESFDHAILRNLTYVVLKNDETWVGFLAIVPRVFIPAICPGTCPPKDVSRLIDAMIGHGMIEHGEQWVALSPDSFASKNYIKRGAVKQNLELYRKC